MVEGMAVDVIKGACMIDSDVLGSYPRPLLMGGVPCSEFILQFEKPAVLELSCCEGLEEAGPLFYGNGGRLFLVWKLEFACSPGSCKDPRFQTGTGGGCDVSKGGCFEP